VVEEADETFLMRAARCCPWLWDLTFEFVGGVLTFDYRLLEHGWYLKMLLDVPCSLTLESRALDPLIFGRGAQGEDAAVLVTDFEFEQ
jgi:hypothetical protein